MFEEVSYTADLSDLFTIMTCFVNLFFNFTEVISCLFSSFAHWFFVYCFCPMTFYGFTTAVVAYGCS